MAMTLLHQRTTPVWTTLAGLALMAVMVSQAPAAEPLKALLVLGGCCHDYPAQQEILVNGLQARSHVKVSVALDPDKTNAHLNPVYENPDWAANFDVIIHDECSSNI